VTVLAFIAGGVAGIIAAVARVAHCNNKRARYWRQERERLQAADERLAAANGRPDGHIVAVAPTRIREPYERQ
jgi:hypothetical protein